MADVVGLEAACQGVSDDSIDAGQRGRVRRAMKGLDAVSARRAGLRIWLEETGDGGAGQRFRQARGLVALLFGSVAALSGAGVVLGIERAGGGLVHVVWFLGLTLGLPWLVLLTGVIGWAWAGRTGVLGWFGAVVSGLIRRWSGAGEWWDGSSELRRVVAASVVRLGQGTALMFQLGAVAGLAGLVMFRHVGFYWESTTEQVMADGLEWCVRLLSAPWAAWWPEAVPGRDWIEATRRIPGAELPADSGPWWRFLLAALVCWGVLPRLLLWVLSAWRERRVLAGLQFQSPACRQLWRKLTAVHRGEVTSGPTDGVLVIDLGGSDPNHDQLRPFFLRRLRVNPVAWEQLGVLDEGCEQRTREALEEAPAGVVLVAEAWDLSPRALAATVARVRAAAGMETRIIVVIGNPAADGSMRPPNDEEREQWERAVDGLGDPALEVASFEEVGS